MRRNDLDVLLEAWLRLTGRQKITLMTTAPDVYFAAARIARHRQISR